MAEIVVGIALLLSLFGNYHQHNKIERLQEVADQNYTEWMLAIEVNKDNADTFTVLRQALDACEIRSADTLRAVNDFREASALKDAALTDLRTRLRATDFGVCRVPDWVDFGGGRQD